MWRFKMWVCFVFSLDSPRWGDSYEYTPYTIFNIKNHPKLSEICSYGTFFQGPQEQVRNSRGKRAISVRATEVLLYSCIIWTLEFAFWFSENLLSFTLTVSLIYFMVSEINIVTKFR